MKSYKREVALGVLLYTLGMFAWGALGNAAAHEIGKDLLPWSIMLIAAAFGLDAVINQLIPMMRK